MQITQHSITVRELTEGYADNQEGGVTGRSGNLDIRPPYQREFVYNDKQRDLVINTLAKGFPLNVMYWAAREDGTHEVMDGQQRTLSICQYVAGAFSRNFGNGPQFFHNLPADEQDKLLAYELMVYICEGSDTEKLDWFRTINIAGEKLTPQELRNAVYHGPWLSDAKRYFSRSECPAYVKGKEYLGGKPLRQELLEAALEWVAHRDGSSVEEYMATHQHDANSNDIWLYFQNVIAWAQAVFPEQRRELRSVDWGTLYQRHHTGSYDSAALELEVSRLMADEDVTRKAGIYPYLLNGQEKHLSIRAFTPRQKREAYERQQGICVSCSNPHPLVGMEADHITPWSKGGRTVASNCQMLCDDCNRRKSNI